MALAGDVIRKRGSAAMVTVCLWLTGGGGSDILRQVNGAAVGACIGVAILFAVMAKAWLQRWWQGSGG